MGPKESQKPLRQKAMSKYSQLLERAGIDLEVILPESASARASNGRPRAQAWRAHLHRPSDWCEVGVSARGGPARRLAPSGANLGTGPRPAPDRLVCEEVEKLVQRVFLLPKGESTPRVVLFCGVERSEGSSWICARAGEKLASHELSKVCLVDANLRSPSLHRHFGADHRRGLADALLRDIPVHGFAQRVGRNLWLVPSGVLGLDVHMRLGTARMQACLAELGTRFGHVLIDAPPAASFADAAVVGKLTAGVILVVEANATRRETARQAKESFESAGVPLLGAVLRFSGNGSADIQEQTARAQSLARHRGVTREG